MKKAGLVVLGISPDTSKAQLKFKENEGLPYTLLADAAKDVATKFDVVKEKNMYGKKVMGIERSTFVIGRMGRSKSLGEGEGARARREGAGEFRIGEVVTARRG